MKRSIFIVIFATLALTYSGCQTKNDIREALKRELTTTNKHLPMTIGFFSITKLEIVNNDYVVHFTIDETQEDLDGYVSTMSRYKSGILTVVFGNNERFKKSFLSSGLNLRLLYLGSISHKKRQIFLSASDIKKASNSSYTSKDLISDYVYEMKKALPLDWGAGLILTSMDIKGNNMLYRINIDKSDFTMDLLKKSEGEGNALEQSIIEFLNDSNTPYDIAFINYIKQSGMGLKYVYWSNKTRETVSVFISPQTIKAKVIKKSY